MEEAGDALVRELFQVLLVFARLGTALMLLPGFGEQYVLARQRLRRRTTPHGSTAYPTWVQNP